MTEDRNQSVKQLSVTPDKEEQFAGIRGHLTPSYRTIEQLDIRILGQSLRQGAHVTGSNSRTNDNRCI